MPKHLLGLKGARSSINVIPSAVEESRGATCGNFAGCLQPSHKATAWQATSLDMTKRFMSGKIVTRVFSIDDYDATLQLWQRVEGLEVAEGDDKEGVGSICNAQSGIEQSGNRWIESCWSRNVRSRWTTRTHLSRGG